MKFSNYILWSYHRNILERLLFHHKKLIKGKILDIGSKNRRYDHLFDGEITAIDIIPKPDYDIQYGDLLDLKFEANSFDSIICIEVFEYLDPADFIKGFDEIHRVLKKNGHAIITIPFFVNDHYDTMRVTYSWVSNHLKKLTSFEYGLFKIGNRYTAIYDLIRDREKIHHYKGLKKIGIYAPLFFIYLAIKYLKLERIQDSLYSGIFIKLKKK